MSLVKVQSKALKKLMMPVPPCVHRDIDYSPGKDGMAARLRKCSIDCDISPCEVGAKVSVSRFNKRYIYLKATSPLELKASYELALQSFDVLAGYLTLMDRECSDKTHYCYQFHSNTWLTDDQLMKLAIDFE
ncbi:hypothetical protein [uncultured Photobacterium sp.]|uniref:hypothetical protein n=1 Tax=uncultured Photobacterium sp. TaxID=173973 RepID=UPI00262C6BD7|nr:hypothetical protein [uncultured Photobacterium sp.]